MQDPRGHQVQARGLVLWIQPEVQYTLNTAMQGSGSGYSQGSNTLDKASGSGSGYIQWFSTLDTARGSGSGYSQASNTLDKASGSGSGYSQGFSTLDWTHPDVLALDAARALVGKVTSFVNG